MPVPDYETLMLPLLRQFATGAKNVAECIPALKREFAITDEEAAVLLPSGRITVLQSRAHWARTYMSKAGLLLSPKRNAHEITELGRNVLAQNPSRIDNHYLATFDSFSNWLATSRAGPANTTSDPHQLEDRLSDSVISLRDLAETPEDAIASASAILNAALRDDLLSLLQDVSPQRFERLILDVLAAMGYGGGKLANSALTKAAGDGGIDGIINEDSLGLDAVYVQAKRYTVENKIGRPQIQQFVGSLTGEGATKGVFVTTSDFSREARDYLNKVQQRIVLINGQRLAELMIQHGVGVRDRATYVVRSVDQDYFAGLGLEVGS